MRVCFEGVLHKAHVAGLGLVLSLFFGLFISLFYQVESGDVKLRSYILNGVSPLP